jgi:hypothetical protein
MSDSCNFNNIYLFVVPKTVGNVISYLNPAQKSLIVSTISNEKILTGEVVLLDPIYLAVDFTLSDTNINSTNDISNTNIVVVKNPNSRRNDSNIATDVSSVITSYFDRRNLILGQVIDVGQLTTNILQIDGVSKIYTARADTGIIVDGLRMSIFNPVYGDISLSPLNGTYTLADYQFPYLYTSDISSRIVVQSNLSNFERGTY